MMLIVLHELAKYRLSLLLCVQAMGLVLTTALCAENNPVGSRTRPSILKLKLTETPRPNYGSPVPSQVSGRVLLKSNGSFTGVGCVSVTDGYSVVKTDARGDFSLRPDPSAVFVYITRPSGYDVEGGWYQPLADEVDFTIKPAVNDENEYIFIHVTDTHVSQNRRSLVGLSRFVGEVNSFTPRPSFVVNSGDLLNLHKALLNAPAAGHADFRCYVGIMNHLVMPYYNVAGDHTDSSYRLKEFPRGDHRCAKALYWEYLGPHFFSFEYGQIHFVSVDFGYHLGRRKVLVDGKNLNYPTNEVQPIHVKWLAQDMAGRSRGAFVVTASEADLIDHCPGFRQLAEEHDIRLQLVGDTHVVSTKSRPVPYRTGGALAGCWWNPKANQLCPDLSPQGYLIYRVTGERMEHFYKGLGQRVAIISHRVAAVWKGRVKVEAHLVQPQPGEHLEFSTDGKVWQKMRTVRRPFYRTVYSASVDSASLPDGLGNFSVRNPSDGEIRSRVIVVANGREAAPARNDGLLEFEIGRPTNWTTPRAPADKVDVLFNGTVVGVVEPDTCKAYSFSIPASCLLCANTLSFRFSCPGDGMTLSGPVFKYGKTKFRDPRDEAIRRVRTAHWGEVAIDWGGFIAGGAAPPDETPFHRRQNVFCFVFSNTN